jgi:sterol desaturase/sphingolipid hydroxylase (fatty acid hydroxylase superfamily)
MDYLFNTEPIIRFSCFVAVLLAMALWEWLAPRRHLTVARPSRWFSNLGLVSLNTLIVTLAVRVLLPLGVVGTALVAREHGWGLFNNVALPELLSVVLAFVALDLAIYLQHRLFHAVPLLWRLHLVHHADLDFDVTTGVRFHTIEILLSLGIKIGTVILLGAPALAVLLFEVLLNATSMFSHGNVRLPAWLDRLLRLFVVTPEMHRVHHSVVVRETNSNFGFNLPWWDYLFRTYRPQPAAGHLDMTIGLAELRDARRANRLHWMLALPLLTGASEYPRGGRTDRPRQAPAHKVQDNGQGNHSWKEGFAMSHREHQSCIRACVDCAQECEHCGNACLGTMPECSRLCIDCAELCWSCSGFMSRGSQFMGEMCRLCAEACDACAAECERHKEEHCQRCAEACRHCAEECRQMAGAAA